MNYITIVFCITLFVLAFVLLAVFIHDVILSIPGMVDDKFVWEGIAIIVFILAMLIIAFVVCLLVESYGSRSGVYFVSRA